MRLCRTMRMGGIALKMGVCLSVASFAHLAMTDILKGMGVSGGRLFLRLFFFGGSKKNGHTRVRGTRPYFLVAQKEKVHSICNQHIYKRLELKIMRKSSANYLGIRIKLYKNVKCICLYVGFIEPTLLSMQKMYYNI